MSITSFVETFQGIRKKAFTYGVSSVPLHPRHLAGAREQATYDRTFRDFIGACHRGYERAQRAVLQELAKIRSDTALSDDEKRYRELVLRRVIDGIAFVMLQQRHHVVRRLVLRNTPAFPEFSELERNVKEAERMNSESRQTFALAADLSTFIHVADIMRIDFRPSHKSIQFIELKTGKVNEVLIDKLAEFKPLDSELRRLSTSDVEPRHQRQAQRMLRQRIRLKKTIDVLRTDRGVDIQSGLPLLLKGPTRDLDSYDEVLDRLFDQAMKVEACAITIDGCLHLGVGHASTADQAQSHAITAVRRAVSMRRQDASKGYAEARKSVTSVLDEEKSYFVQNVFLNNLHGLTCRPFPLYSVNEAHLGSLVRGTLVLYGCFDLIGFFELCAKLRKKIRLTSRKEAAQYQQKGLMSELVSFERRLVEIGASRGSYVMGRGMLARFFLDLVPPRQFLKDE